MKILVFCLPAIGDSLMVSPMISLLKKKYPDATIDIACMFEGVKYIFKNNPDINSVFKLSLYKENKIKGFHQILRLRRKKYHISILPIPSFRREYHIVQWMVGAKKRISHRYKKGHWSELHFLNTNMIPIHEDEHNVINNLNLLSLLDIYWKREVARKDITYTLYLDPEDRIYGENYLKKLGWKSSETIGIHPGSTLSPAALLRRWPIERYAKVAKNLITKKRKRIIIFVGPEEYDIGNLLYKEIANPTHCVIANGNFGQALGVLSKVSLLVCNDNGFGHIAVALKKRIITLWASTNNIWSLPYSETLVTLIRPKNFTPWYRYDLKRTIPKSVKGGIDRIQTNSVLRVIDKELGEHYSTS